MRATLILVALLTVAVAAGRRDGASRLPPPRDAAPIPFKWPACNCKSGRPVEPGMADCELESYTGQGFCYLDCSVATGRPCNNTHFTIPRNRMVKVFCDDGSADFGACHDATFEELSNSSQVEMLCAGFGCRGTDLNVRGAANVFISTGYLFDVNVVAPGAKVNVVCGDCYGVALRNNVPMNVAAMSEVQCGTGHFSQAPWLVDGHWCARGGDCGKDVPLCGYVPE